MYAYPVFLRSQIEGMRIQQELQAKVQLLYKMGNRAEAEKLLAKLKPDE